MFNVERSFVLFTAAAPVALTLALFTSTPSHAAISCTPIHGETHCVCHGDSECNDMFSKYCKETSGTCDTGHDACECTIKANIKGNPTKHKPPVTNIGVTKAHQNQQ